VTCRFALGRGSCCAVSVCEPEDGVGEGEVGTDCWERDLNINAGRSSVVMAPRLRDASIVLPLLVFCIYVILKRRESG
jgi:hypothetical protein